MTYNDLDGGLWIQTLQLSVIYNYIYIYSYIYMHLVFDLAPGTWLQKL